LAPKKKGTRANPQSPFISARSNPERILRESKHDKNLKYVQEPKSSSEITSSAQYPKVLEKSDNELSEVDN